MFVIISSWQLRRNNDDRPRGGRGESATSGAVNSITPRKGAAEVVRSLLALHTEAVWWLSPHPPCIRRLRALSSHTLHQPFEGSLLSLTASAVSVLSPLSPCLAIL